MKRGSLKNLRVGKKLMYSYGIIIVLYILTVAAALFGIRTVSDTMDTFYTNSFQVTSSALEVRAGNAAAVALYHKWGFLPVGRRKNYYTAPTEDAILMTVTL